MDERVQTTVRLSPAVYEQIRRKAFEDKTTFLKLIERACTFYLEGGSPPVLQAVAHQPNKWHAMLSYVLESGVENAVVAVKDNLVAFYDYARMAKGESRASTPGEIEETINEAAAAAVRAPSKKRKG